MSALKSHQRCVVTGRLQLKRVSKEFGVDLAELPARIYFQHGKGPGLKVPEFPLKPLPKGRSFVRIYLYDPIYTSCVTSCVLCTSDVKKTKQSVNASGKHSRQTEILGAGYTVQTEVTHQAVVEFI